MGKSQEPPLLDPMGGMYVVTKHFMCAYCGKMNQLPVRPAWHDKPTGPGLWVVRRKFVPKRRGGTGPYLVRIPEGYAGVDQTIVHAYGPIPEDDHAH